MIKLMLTQASENAMFWRYPALSKSTSRRLSHNMDFTEEQIVNVEEDTVGIQQ